MKAVIAGKRYDTDTSILIGEDGSGGSANDFRYWSAGLYKSPRAGLFFLAGRGGPLTRWAETVAGNGRIGSEKIIPLDDDEALEWAERHLPVETVEKYFGARIEDA